MKPAVMVWSDLRDRAVDEFKAFPPAADEESLLAAFQRAPVAVEASLQRIIGRVRAGKVRNGWRVWAMDCSQQSGDVSVSSGPDSERLVSKAEVWVRNAGAHFDRESELLDELFERHDVKAVDSPAVRERLLGVWREVRPLGEA